MVYSDIPSVEGVCMKGTDIQDIKGRDIYEADVLSNGRIRVVVEYDEDDQRFVLRHGPEIRGFYDSRDFVVLGNAFENKDLV